jgi:hypothetical protein
MPFQERAQNGSCPIPWQSCQPQVQMFEPWLIIPANSLGKAMVYSLATRRNSNALSSWISGRVYWRGCKITEEGIREASSPGLFCANGVLARSRGPEDLPGQTTCWVPSTGTMHSASTKKISRNAIIKSSK